jgi:hypothetical protein
MQLIESLLIQGGEFMQWAWAGLLSFFAVIFSFLDRWLNPLLSPLLAAVNPVCTWIADAVYWVLNWLPAWLELTLVSLVLGVVMLLAFRYTSNQTEIARAKDAIKANLLALKLYKDDLFVTFRTQGRLFLAVARLQRYVLVPVLLMTPPMLLLFAQMAARHQWRPLRAGESTILRVRWAEGLPAEVNSARLESAGGVKAEVGPLPGKSDVVWRIRALTPGRHNVHIRIGAVEFEKEIVVGEAMSRVSPVRPGRSWTAQLLYPLESRMPELRAIEVDYPALRHWFYGADWWILWLLVISMLAAFILRGRFGVVF